ncbi:hypothetical protein F4703DRAFT_1928579 [Phycomyces blakesleeanus]
MLKQRAEFELGALKHHKPSEIRNCSCWKGGDSSRKTKEVLCLETREIIVNNDITNWSNSDICSKIQYLHNKFKDATNFLNGTGQDILNDINESEKTPEEAEKTLEDILEETCSHEEVETEDEAEFDAEVQDDEQLDKTLLVYHLSTTISETIEESVKLNHIHVELMQKKFEAEVEVNERQFCYQGIVYGDRMMMKERWLNIEAKQLENDCNQSKLQYIAKLESLELSKQYILGKLDIKL